MQDPPPQYSALVEFRFAGEPSEALMLRIEDILDDVLPRLTAPDMFSDDLADPILVTCDANIRWVRPINMERP